MFNSFVKLPEGQRMSKACFIHHRTMVFHGLSLFLSIFLCNNSRTIEYIPACSCKEEQLVSCSTDETRRVHARLNLRHSLKKNSMVISLASEHCWRITRSRSPSTLTSAESGVKFSGLSSSWVRPRNHRWTSRRMSTLRQLGKDRNPGSQRHASKLLTSNPSSCRFPCVTWAESRWELTAARDDPHIGWSFTPVKSKKNFVQIGMWKAPCLGHNWKDCPPAGRCTGSVSCGTSFPVTAIFLLSGELHSRNQSVGS